MHVCMHVCMHVYVYVYVHVYVHVYVYGYVYVYVYAYVYVYGYVYVHIYHKTATHPRLILMSLNDAPRAATLRRTPAAARTPRRLAGPAVHGSGGQQGSFQRKWGYFTGDSRLFWVETGLSYG